MMTERGVHMEAMQIQLPLDPSFESALDALQHDIAVSGLSIKNIEIALGRKSGYLSRRLGDNPTDEASGMLTVRDMEAIIAYIEKETGRKPLSVVHYFIKRHLRDSRHERERQAQVLLDKLESIEAFIAQLKRDKTVETLGKRGR